MVAVAAAAAVVVVVVVVVVMVVVVVVVVVVVEAVVVVYDMICINKCIDNILFSFISETFVLVMFFKSAIHLYI